MYKAVLVDDELHCTELLQMLLAEHFGDTIQVVASFQQSAEAMRYLLNQKVDLVFLDIEMPEMNGFELLQKIMPTDADVVFVTAYDQYAIKAFSYSAISYLLKPVDDEDLIKVITRWQDKLQKKLHPLQWQMAQDQLQHRHSPKTKVALPTSEGLEFIAIADIIRCEADNNYTRLFCAGQATHLICRTLKDVEKVLNESGFIRIHQSHLINPQHMRKLIRNDGGSIVMDDGSELPISRAKKLRILDLLSGIDKL